MCARRPISVRTRAICRSRRTARSPMSAPNGALVQSSTQDVYNARAHAGARCSACRPRRCGCSTTKAPARSAAAATRTPRRPPRSCRRRSAGRCACSTCAGTSTAGTITARRISPKCAPASTPTASSSPTSITAGSTAGPSPRRCRTSRCRSRASSAPSGSASITVNPMSTGSMYVVPNRRVISHAVPMEGYLRGAALRSPLDLSFAFASEQTIDELAHALKMDPLEFRRKNIGDKRWLGVLEAAAEAADWKPRVMASSLSNAEVVTRPRHRARHAPCVLWRGGGRHRGQQAHRRDRRQASLRRARLRPCRQSGAGRDPDRSAR